MDLQKDFNLFARSNGVSSLALHDYQKFQNSYINPNVIEERQLNVSVIDIFSRLMYDRILFLGTGIDDHVANIIQAQLLFLDSTKPGTDIQMYIASGGGSVYSGYGIIDTMDIISSDVATICTSLAASMAAVILSNGAKGKRSALKHSRIMIHQPLGGIGQSQASDIEINAREILKVKRELYEILAQNTGKSYEEIEKNSDRDYWMTAIEAQNYGMIDEVLGGKK